MGSRSKAKDSTICIVPGRRWSHRRKRPMHMTAKAIAELPKKISGAERKRLRNRRRRGAPSAYRRGVAAACGALFASVQA